MKTPLHILLVDDDQHDAASVMGELCRAFPDLQVEQVTEAEGLGQALDARGFDLVILDGHLPWTDGSTVLHSVRDHSPDCPVIMLTDSDSPQVAVEALEGGLGDYVIRLPKGSPGLPAVVALEMEMIRQRQALNEAEARYRSVFERVPVGVYRIAPAGQILEANPPLVQMLGYPDRETLLAVNAGDIFVDRGERQRWQALLEQEGAVGGFEVRLRRMDGTTIWVEDSARVVRGSDGGVLYFEGFLTDISERKQAEVALWQSERSASLGLLTGGVAHQLRNPLAVVSAFAQLALQHPDDTELHSQCAEKIDAAAQRASWIIENALKFSAPAAVQMTDINVQPVIEETLALLADHLMMRNITLRNEIQPDLPRVHGNAQLLQQVFTNLVLNACDAMPRGGTLETACRAAEPDSVEIQFRDTGRGIAPEKLQRIFEPFSTTTPAGEGTGLGLSISSSIIKQHRGSIDVRSEVGKGTTFTVRLPRTSHS
jgi:PAS domain S-box-containing protein